MQGQWLIQIQMIYTLDQCTYDEISYSLTHYHKSHCVQEVYAPFGDYNLSIES